MKISIFSFNQEHTLYTISRPTSLSRNIIFPATRSFFFEMKPDPFFDCRTLSLPVAVIGWCSVAIGCCRLILPMLLPAALKPYGRIRYMLEGAKQPRAAYSKKQQIQAARPKQQVKRNTEFVITPYFIITLLTSKTSIYRALIS